MSSPRVSSQARATCAAVAPASAAIALTSSALQVVLEVLAGETRIVLAEVVGAELVGGADGPGEKAAAQRGVGHEADPELAQHRQHLGLGIAGP